MSSVASAAQGLFAAVECLNSTARDRIVRTWLLACSDADAAEWRRLVEAQKKRRQRSIQPLEPVNAPENSVPLEQEETIGTRNGVSRWNTGKPAGQVLAAAKPLPPPSPAPSPGPPSPPAPTPTHVTGAPARGEVPTTTKSKQTDAEFIAELQADPTYAGINIDLEAGKMRRWCSTNHQTPSRRRFVNWLNRAVSDRAMPPAPGAGTINAANPTQTNGTHQRYPTYGGTPTRGATDRNAGGANANGTSDYSRVGKVELGAVPNAA